MKFPEQYRWNGHPIPKYHSRPGDRFGCFIVPANKGAGLRELHIIASEEDPENGIYWQHASVSLEGTFDCASWEEMCIVKSLFWDENECVVQFHPPAKDYINYINVHPGVLHLWRCTNQEFPMPPKNCV